MPLPIILLLVASQTSDYAKHVDTMLRQFQAPRVHVRYQLSKPYILGADMWWEGNLRQKLEIRVPGQTVTATRIHHDVLNVDALAQTYEAFSDEDVLHPVGGDTSEAIAPTHPAFLFPGPVAKMVRSATQTSVTATGHGWHLVGDRHTSDENLHVELDLTAANLPTRFSINYSNPGFKYVQALTVTSVEFNGPSSSYSVEPPQGYVPLYLPETGWPQGDEVSIKSWPMLDTRGQVTTFGKQFGDKPVLIFVTGPADAFEQESREAFERVKAKIGNSIAVAHLSMRNEAGALRDSNGFWQKQYANFGLPIALLVRKDGYIAMAWMGFDGDEVKEMVNATKELLETGTVLKD